MASTHSSWRLHIKSTIDYSSSTSVSALCADPLFPGPCSSECTRGSSIGHELDQGPTRRVEATQPYFGHQDGPIYMQITENLTADVHYAINKCESLGSGKQLILHGNPSAIARDFFPAYGCPSTSFSECAHPVLHVTSGHARSRY